MADKKYELTFRMSDGSNQKVVFTVPAGADGKTAFEYAQDGGFTGTEVEFARKLAETDKLFEEIKTITYSDTLEWDGDVSGRESFGDSVHEDYSLYNSLYRISNDVPSLSCIQQHGGNMILTSGEETQVISFADVDFVDSVGNEDVATLFFASVNSIYYFCVIDERACTDVLNIPVEHAGIYFYCNPDNKSYISQITINDYSKFIQTITIENYLDTGHLPTTVPVIPAAADGQFIRIKAVDEDGMPTEWEATNEIILHSSTEESTKKFKLTIDDNGTFIPVEIVE